MSDKTCIVVLGQTRYHVQRPWPSISYDFTGISDVSVLTDGRIAVLQRKSPHIQVFLPSGELDDEWNIPALVWPHYLCSDFMGGVLIADVDGHQIIAVDGRGSMQWSLGCPKHPKWMEPFNHPTAAYIGADNTMYVSDGYGNSCLHRFDANRQLMYTIGEQGCGKGQFSTPHDVIQLRTGKVLVVDRENHRVQVFTSSGEYLVDVSDLYKPMAAEPVPDGGFMVTDQTPRLSLFTSEGKLVGRCRTYSANPHGLSVAGDNCIYLAEMMPDTLMRLVPIQ